ncbi:DUF4870 domain-containing protein [Aquipuribacter nitratireducens]|uniref:DUF4870 domain-containing protein n=1 Tax=Aquipuribacter nitratireducens TaxID=650104 RepID=A0ABW0GJJ0_9MICO
MSDPNQPADPGRPGDGQRPGPYGPPPGQQPGQQPGPQSGPYGPPPGPPPGPSGQPQYGPPPGQQQYGQQAQMTHSDERTWAALAHGLVIIGFFIPGLVAYLVFKDRSPYLRDQGREALNWGITVTIIEVVAYVLVTVTFGILFFLPALSFVLRLVFGILAALAASRHEDYRYPFNLRLVK